MTLTEKAHGWKLLQAEPGRSDILGLKRWVLFHNGDPIARIYELGPGDFRINIDLQSDRIDYSAGNYPDLDVAISTLHMLPDYEHIQHLIDAHSRPKL